MLSNSTRTMVATSMLSSGALFFNSTSITSNSNSLHSHTNQSLHYGPPVSTSTASSLYTYNSTFLTGTNTLVYNAPTPVVMVISTIITIASSSSPVALKASIFPMVHSSTNLTKPSSLNQTYYPMSNSSIIPGNLTYSNSSLLSNDSSLVALDKPYYPISNSSNIASNSTFNNHTFVSNDTNSYLNYTLSHTNSTDSGNKTVFHSPLAAFRVAKKLTLKKKIEKAVFAHYMVGNVLEEHAHADIDSAAAIGLAGFAVNIGDPAQDFVLRTLDFMFDYARDNHPSFRIFISMDVWATKVGGNTLTVYNDILARYKGHEAYYQGPDGKSFVSTFSDGGFHNDQWSDYWANNFANEVYFVPNFDNATGYWEADPGWWAYWGDVVQGCFSWDSVWPKRGTTGGGNIYRDQIVIEGTAAHNKTYMIGLSPLQYKNAYDTNYYRQGGLNLPIRMENILSMDPSPDLVEIISWNDGPESHYIGWLWLEQNNDTAPMKYANQKEWSHTGWQPLITSFIDAFKQQKSSSEMSPPSNKIAVGALWYKTMLQDSICPETNKNPLTMKYSQKTDGWETGSDSLNWAVVLPESGAEMSIHLISNGNTIAKVAGKAGLNYGDIPKAQAGFQRMELLDASGSVLLAASGGRCISDGCPDCIYNMNYQVIELTEDNGFKGTCPQAICEKLVFAHYMVGTITPEHAHQDIAEAAAMELDGFALNIGDPALPWVRDTLNYMFDYTRDNFPDFKLFISMDVWATKSGGWDVHNFEKLLGDFKGHPAYLKGPNGASFISTFSDGGFQDFEWKSFREHWAQDLYFVPDFDKTSGYNTSDPGWWEYWGDIVDGMFSWETAWPQRNTMGSGDISRDIVINDGAISHGKSYMIPLSALQYKNAYDTNYYRQGELNLVMRMENILSMENPPAFVQVISWNDGPESHYIGNLWLEQNNDTQPLKYANSHWSHAGWQPLITSFIGALKAGLPASGMIPPIGKIAVGAMWYKTILSTSVCPNEGSSNYTKKPDGWETATDSLNWAVVLPNDPQGMQIRTITNGRMDYFQGKQGLNYGTVSVEAGDQRLELLDWAGNVLLVASGGRCVSSSCPDCIYNMNYQVVELKKDTGVVGTCPYQACKRQVFAHYMVGNVEAEHARTDIADAARMGFDGFALNIGDPAQYYVRNTFNYMFDYARDNFPGFKLFISLDLWAEGASYGHTDLAAYHDILQDFKGHPAYLQGPNGHSFVSSFSSGGLNNTDWEDWKSSWANQLYLVPDLDDTKGYNTSDPGWWHYWGDVIDGAMSWETAWANPGVTAVGSVDIDKKIIAGTTQHQKSYMMPLSALQYKNAYDTNYYREGDLNLVMRMEKILSLETAPSFVEVLTWNDGPESHYIGNLWLEQNNDTIPGKYATQADFPHTAWQPIVTAFISAFKEGKSATSMAPPSGQIAIGALWYKTILQSAVCPEVDDDKYSQKPDGFNIASDQLNWAIVLSKGFPGMKIRAWSNGKIIQIVDAVPGLNYGAARGAQAGPQKLDLIDASGTVHLTASGGRCIATDCPDCIYNMNPQVVPLNSYSTGEGYCPTMDCGVVNGVPIPALQDSLSSGTAAGASWASQSGQRCTFKECGETCDKSKEMEVGHSNKCRKGNAPICCPYESLPTCEWRGGGSSCHGACHENEVTLFYDSYGDGDRCTWGKKVFCCVTETFTNLINGCKYAGCGKDCSTIKSSTDLEKVSSFHDPQVCTYPTRHSGSQERNICCPKASNIKNCHWVGQGSCDQNNCDDNDITLKYDDYGSGRTKCGAGLNDRKKSLCCDAPTTGNIFLPVALDKLFPTTPDSSNVPEWDLQLLSAPSVTTQPVTVGAGPNGQGFGFVVIDGPRGSVATLNKRDGSHYEFVECPLGNDRQIVRIFCTDLGINSNCGDIFVDGIEGTVIKMPDNCGNGVYAVAHQLKPAANQTFDMSSHINATSEILELDISYDFGLVQKNKRAAGDVYLRIDYSNIPGYWSAMVDSAGERRKRSDGIDKRFFSPKPSSWAERFNKLATTSLARTPFVADLRHGIVGETKTCSGAEDNFAEIGVSGTVTAKSQWGFSIVGTISPFKIEQAYGFFDNDITMEATVNIQTYGHLKVNGEKGSLFKNALKFKNFVQPGLLSFQPSLQVGVSLRADIQMNADVRVPFKVSTSTPIRQTFPSTAGTAKGGISFSGGKLDGTINDAERGNFRLGLTPTMNMDIQLSAYGTDDIAVHEVVSSYYEAYAGVILDEGCPHVQTGTSKPYVQLTNINSNGKAAIWSSDISSLPQSISESQVYSNSYPGACGTASSTATTIYKSTVFSGVKLLECVSTLDSRYGRPDVCYLPEMYGELPFHGYDEDGDRLDAGNFNDEDDNYLGSSFDNSVMNPKRAILPEQFYQKRGGFRYFKVFKSGGKVIQEQIATTNFKSVSYPARKALMKAVPGVQYVYQTGYGVLAACNSYGVTQVNQFNTPDVSQYAETEGNSGWAVEHPWELGNFARFAQYTSGLRRYRGTSIGPLPKFIPEQIWKLFAELSYRDLGSSHPGSPMENVYRCFGDGATYATRFWITTESLNGAKSRFWKLEQPFDLVSKNSPWFKGNTDDKMILLRDAFASSAYMMLTSDTLRLIYNDIFKELQTFENVLRDNGLGIYSFTQWWQTHGEFFHHDLEVNMQNWLRLAIQSLRTEIAPALLRGSLEAVAHEAVLRSALKLVALQKHSIF